MPILPRRTPIASDNHSRLIVVDNDWFHARNEWRVRSIATADTLTTRKIRRVRVRDGGNPQQYCTCKLAAHTLRPRLEPGFTL